MTGHSFAFKHHHHTCQKCGTPVCCMVGHPTSFEKAGGTPKILCQSCWKEWDRIMSRKPKEVTP